MFGGTHQIIQYIWPSDKNNQSRFIIKEIHRLEWKQNHVLMEETKTYPLILMSHLVNYLTEDIKHMNKLKDKLQMDERAEELIVQIQS